MNYANLIYRLSLGHITRTDVDDTCMISFTHESFDTGTTLPIIETREFYGLFINLGSDIRFTVSDVKGILMTDHFNLLYLPAHLTCKLKLEKAWYRDQKVRNKSLSIQLSPPIMQLFVDAFPILHQVGEGFRESKLGALNLEGFKLTPSMYLGIYEILHNRFGGELRNMFLRKNVINLLFNCLEHATAFRHPFAERLTREEIKVIEETRDFILEHPDKHFSLNFLAKRTGLNELKLAYGFMMKYLLPVHDFQVVARMKKAKELLHTNMSIIEVAEAIGFKNHSDFSKAFKDKFGFTPSAYRNGDFS